MPEHPEQFEFITNYVQNTNAVLKGEKLTGDLDFLTACNISLLIHPELAAIFTVKTSLSTTDTDGHTVDAESELVMNVYKYGFRFDLIELYGLYCYATIFNYYTLATKMVENNIMHDEAHYKPTIVVHSLNQMEKQILEVLHKAYGDSL